MKKQMIIGLLGLLLMSSAALRAEETSQEADESTVASEGSVDCFYENNRQHEALCQQKEAPQSVATASSIFGTNN